MDLKDRRKVRLTTHAVDRVIERFPEAALFKRKYPNLFMSALVGCAGAAKESEYEHYLVGNGFLEGSLRIPRAVDTVPIYFVYIIKGDAYVILTAVTKEQLLNMGSRRKT